MAKSTSKDMDIVFSLKCLHMLQSCYPKASWSNSIRKITLFVNRIQSAQYLQRTDTKMLIIKYYRNRNKDNFSSLTKLFLTSAHFILSNKEEVLERMRSITSLALLGPP